MDITIWKWHRELTKYKEAVLSGQENPTLTEEQKQIVRLQKELKETQLSIEILKKTMGIFASPNNKNLLSRKQIEVNTLF